MKPELVLSDVKGPVSVEVCAEVKRSQFDDGFGHGGSPAHAGALHSVLDEILTSAFHRPAGNGEAECQIFVVTHVGGVVLEVCSHFQQSLLLASNQPAFGDGLAKALDDLSNIALQNAQRHEFRIYLGFGGTFGLKHMRGPPDAFQNVDQIQDQRHLHALRYRSEEHTSELQSL